MTLDLAFKIVESAIGLGLLLLAGGRWIGRLETKRQNGANGSDTIPPGRLREVIATLELSVKEARALAHDARNIAHVTKGEASVRAEQMDRDLDRIDRAIAENTRRIDELWRAVRSGEGV